MKMRVCVKEIKRKVDNGTFKAVEGICKDGHLCKIKFRKASKMSPEALPLGRCTIEVENVQKDNKNIYELYWATLIGVVENDDTSQAFAIKEEDLPF